MINDMIKSINQLMLQNEEVASKLASIKSADEAIAILAENGITVTEDELKEMTGVVKADELPVELLEMVAGGGKVSDFLWGFFDGLADGWNETKEFFSGIGGNLKKKKKK